MGKTWREPRMVPVKTLLDLTGDALGFWQIVVEGYVVKERPAVGWIIPEEVSPGRGKAKAERDKARARRMGPLVKARLAEKIKGGWRVLPLREPPEKSKVTAQKPKGIAAQTTGSSASGRRAAGGRRSVRASARSSIVSAE